MLCISKLFVDYKWFVKIVFFSMKCLSTSIVACFGLIAECVVSEIIGKMCQYDSYALCRKCAN